MSICYHYLNGNVPHRRNVHVESLFHTLTGEEFRSRYSFSKQSTRESIRILSPGIELVDSRAPHGILAWNQVGYSWRCVLRQGFITGKQNCKKDSQQSVLFFINLHFSYA